MVSNSATVGCVIAQTEDRGWSRTTLEAFDKAEVEPPAEEPDPESERVDHPTVAAEHNFAAVVGTSESGTAPSERCMPLAAAMFQQVEGFVDRESKAIAAVEQAALPDGPEPSQETDPGPGNEQVSASGDVPEVDSERPWSSWTGGLSRMLTDFSGSSVTEPPSVPKEVKETPRPVAIESNGFIRPRVWEELIEGQEAPVTADGLVEKQFEDNKSQGKKYKWTTKFEDDRSLNAVQQYLVGAYDREKIGHKPDEIQAGTEFGPRHSAKMEILYEAAKTQRLYKVEDTARRSGGGVQTWAITLTAPRQAYLVCYGCNTLGPLADSKDLPDL